MYNGKTFLGIITARGGSKGLPGKNIKPLCGKPLISWTFDAAKKCRYIDRFILSTDDESIAAVAKERSVDVPFMRPEFLASDTATSIDVVEHSYNFIANEDKAYDYIILLEPTSPLREAADIDRAIEQLLNSADADSIVGICKAESVHPSFMLRKTPEGFIKGYEDERIAALRRQEIEDVYFLEGTIYIAEAKSLFEKRTFCHDKTLGYEVPKWKSPEVDDIYDFLHIEAILNYHQESK